MMNENMGAPVLSTWRYRVKGARGRSVPFLVIKEGIGVTGDRRYAVRVPGRPSHRWHPKTYFQVCMTEPRMANQIPRFHERKLDPAWLQELGATLGDAQPSVLDTGGEFNMVDTDPFRYTPTVSFLNLATVRDLQRRTGLTIDSRRFRMNVWYDNADPWSELIWADDFPGARKFDVGGIAFQMQDACERCEAINANPDTGERDLDLLPALEAALKARGYQGSPHRKEFNVMGFLATPLSSGRLWRGQKVVMH